MKLPTLSTAVAILSPVTAHTIFSTLFINDVDQGDGTCVRMPMTPGNATDPINDLASNDMACGYDGTVGVTRVCPVSQSSKLSFLFREWADNSRPGSLDPSHKGPCAVYMKAVSSASSDTAIGKGWFKIWDNGYNNSTSQWCTDRLIANNGFLSVTIPVDLAGGYYLVRPELLALHQADKTPPNPQFYVGCAQIFLNSTATSLPSDTVSIPGFVSITDPSVIFNIYDPKWPYPMFGPEPYISRSSPSMSVKTVTEQTEGLLPENVVLTNANWWGIELESYSTEDGCWNASKACFEQCTACYNSAPPTGSKNCQIWEAKCTTVQNACNANNFTGPPNKGVNLNPQLTITYTSIPAAASQAEEVYYDHESTGTQSPTILTNPSTSLNHSLYLPPTPSSAPSLSTSTVNISITVDLHPDTTSNSPPSAYPMESQVSEINTSSLAAGPLATLAVSLDATCGVPTGQTCLDSEFGNCCSSHGWCGSSPVYCGDGCQAAFGTCGD